MAKAVKRCTEHLQDIINHEMSQEASQGITERGGEVVSVGYNGWFQLISISNVCVTIKVKRDVFNSQMNAGILLVTCLRYGELVLVQRHSPRPHQGPYHMTLAANLYPVKKEDRKTSNKPFPSSGSSIMSHLGLVMYLGTKVTHALAGDDTSPRGLKPNKMEA
ncbi:hypothetical protein Q8A73_002670 [Channa argus]|nr:hypothetical protein Q8A73_002670 [Channa argus]